MGNCVEVTAKSLSPSTTRNCSSGTSTARTDSSFTTKFSSIGSSSCEHTTDNEGYPEGRILQFPNIKVFTFLELKSATSNFRPDAVLGEGGFGTVYKGWLDDKTLTPTKRGFGMVVAVKKLKSESSQGLAEWQSEVNFLGRLSHPNLVKLLGYCWEDKELLLVYEFMPRGSVENHLFRSVATFEPLPWSLRLKILIGAARGLAFLHSCEKQVIYRDFKASNILLDSNYKPKLSDFGLAKLGPTGGNSHLTTQVVGTYGYAAPEYVATGHLYVTSDVYGFGVVLLEFLSGLKVLDMNRPTGRQNLVNWAKPLLSDRRNLSHILDQQLVGQCPAKTAHETAQLAFRCLDTNPRSRPSMKEVVETLERIESTKGKSCESSRSDNKKKASK